MIVSRRDGRAVVRVERGRKRGGGEENEDGHGDQLSALRREPSVTFPRGFSSKEDLEIGTPKLGGMMSSSVFANVDDATNSRRGGFGGGIARRRSMDEFRRPASISSPRRGLSSAFIAIDLASARKSHRGRQTHIACRKNLKRRLIDCEINSA